MNNALISYWNIWFHSNFFGEIFSLEESCNVWKKKSEVLECSLYLHNTDILFIYLFFFLKKVNNYIVFNVFFPPFKDGYAHFNMYIFHF